MARTRTLIVFGFVVLLTSFSPRGFTDDLTSDDSDDSDDDWGDDGDSGMGCSSSSDDDWDDDSSDDDWGDDGYDWDDDDSWQDDSSDDSYYDDYDSSSSSGLGCGDGYEVAEPEDDYWAEDPEYDHDDETYEDDYDDHYDDYGGSGWGCSGPYLHHDSCKERCRNRYDQCMKDFGFCQDWDAAVVDAGDCPDCSIEHRKCVEQC